MAKKYIVQAYIGPDGQTNIDDSGSFDYKVIIPDGYKIIYVGVQGLPGIRLGLGSSTNVNSVYLNGTGYFELDLENTGAFLNGIYVNKEDFLLRSKNNNSKGYLIIDCIAVKDEDLKKDENEVTIMNKGGEV